MLSIDGFECAGHPGEDDVGGLLLVSWKLDLLFSALSFTQVFLSAHSARSRRAQAQDPLHRLGRHR
jgi:hypothetical protein